MSESRKIGKPCAFPFAINNSESEAHSQHRFSGANDDCAGTVTTASYPSRTDTRVSRAMSWTLLSRTSRRLNVVATIFSQRWPIARRLLVLLCRFRWGTTVLRSDSATRHRRTGASRSDAARRYAVIWATGAQGPRMKFEPLHHVLHAIANCKDATRVVGNQEFRRAWQITEAAKDLQQQLCNAPDPHPGWMENRRNRYIFNEGVAEEGMALIDSAAGWYDYEVSRRLAFLAADSRVRQGRQIVTPLMEPVVEENGQWTRQEFFRALSIGFDRSEVVKFLDATRITYRFDDGWVDRSQGDAGGGAPVPTGARPGDTESPPDTTLTVRLHTTMRRRRFLDPVIDEAVTRAGNTNLADVFFHLRNMALESTPPFTGEISKGGALFYTDEENCESKLTRDGLKQRLYRRRRAAEEACEHDPKAPA